MLDIYILELHGQHKFYLLIEESTYHTHLNPSHKVANTCPSLPVQARIYRQKYTLQKTAPVTSMHSQQATLHSNSASQQPPGDPNNPHDTQDRLTSTRSTVSCLGLAPSPNPYIIPGTTTNTSSHTPRPHHPQSFSKMPRFTGPSISPASISTRHISAPEPASTSLSPLCGRFRSI